MPGYNDTPQSTQRISDTQSLIRTNFSSIDTTFSVNHVAIIHATDYGKHKFVTLPEQAASPTTLVNEGGVFTRQGAYTSVSELCFRRENNGSVIEMTTAGLGNNGWSRLPSGLLIKWGRGTATAGLYTYTFPVAATIPVFTTIYTILVNVWYVLVPENQDGNGFVRLSRFEAPWTSFNVYASYRTNVGPGGPLTFQYLAIGI